MLAGGARIGAAGPRSAANRRIDGIVNGLEGFCKVAG